MAQLKATTINGDLTVENNITATGSINNLFLENSNLPISNDEIGLTQIILLDKTVQLKDRVYLIMPFDSDYNNNNNNNNFTISGIDTLLDESFLGTDFNKLSFKISNIKGDGSYTLVSLNKESLSSDNKKIRLTIPSDTREVYNIFSYIIAYYGNSPATQTSSIEYIVHRLL